MKDGQPYKMRAKRVSDSLSKQKLIKRRHTRFVLTGEGKRVLAELGGQRPEGWLCVTVTAKTAKTIKKPL